MSTSPAASVYEAWRNAALADEPLSREDALRILRGDDIDLLALLHAAGEVRSRHFDNAVTIHVLDNVRNGACPEDCGYCGQSKDSAAPVQPYKLKSVEAIVAEAAAAQQRGAYRFCMALSGRGPNDRDIAHMCDAIAQIRSLGMRTCLSTGILGDEAARKLADAGLDRLNHNLNTSERHYPSICSTHTYDDRVRTLQSARDAGIGLCSGLIVGMAETHDDLLDVIYALRQMRAESIPVNFLLPIEGNRVHEPISGGAALSPQYVLRVLCLVRLVNPKAEVRIAAGREHHLRSLQPLGLYPANSLFMEGYLLTQGQAAGETLQMILDAGFKPVLDNPQLVPTELRALIESPREPGRASPPPEFAATPFKPTVVKKPKPTAFVPVEAVGRPG